MLTDYKTLVFDCDGVILDSNKIKSEAFYNAALPYGKQAAGMLRDYHKANGGISRYVKFRFFLDHIVPEGSVGPGVDQLLASYAEHIQKGLKTCAVAKGIHKLRLQTNTSRWLVASGGDQEELRSTFTKRQIAHYFEGGIYGSPDNKIEILKRELSLQNILTPAIFLGDSKYDFSAASASGLDFIFVSDWSDVPDWELFVRSNKLKCVSSLARLSELIEDFQATQHIE